MTVTPASFRIDFPEFADATSYADSGINLWIALGNQLINPARFGPSAPQPNNPPVGLFDILLELFVAHNLVLEKQALDTASRGGTPGLTPGIISSKTVGPVSAGYDTSAGIIPSQGHWNLTIYGLRFRQIFLMGGAGAMQITGHINRFGVAGPFTSGVGAWPGPFPYPAPGGTGFTS